GDCVIAKMRVKKRCTKRRTYPTHALQTSRQQGACSAMCHCRALVDHGFAAAYHHSRRSLGAEATALPLLPARKRKAAFVTQ
ncbi:MAG: hypothetical protein WA129_11090, partial [Acidovorax sp.]